jgi:hypothetical protein
MPAEGDDELRGPAGGVARSHAGLQSFWEHLEEPPDDALVPELDRWLTQGPACAVVLGAQSTRRRARLAAWAQSVASRRAAEVIFLPLSPVHGTATIRDALMLLYGLFPNSETAVYSIPRSPAELRAAIALALQGVGWVAQDPNADEPVLLLILEGIDELADGEVTELLSFEDLGEGARIVLAAREEMECMEPSWPRFHCPEPDIEQPIGSATEMLDALASTFAPVSAGELEAIGFAAAPGEMTLWFREPDGRLRFRDDDLRRAWALGSDCEAIEERLVTAGLELLRCEPADVADTAYRIEYLGAHLKRRPSRDSMELVSPRWLAWWRTRPAWVLGFLSDVDAARDAAEERLAQAENDGERAEALADIVRCALVEGALFSKEGSRHAERDRKEPYRLPQIDLGRPTGAAQARADAVAALLSGSAPVVKRGDALDEARLRAASADELGRWLSAPEPPALDGIAGLLDLADRTEGVYRVTAYAAVAPYLPEAERAIATKRAVEAYWKYGDRDTQRALLSLAPWMTIEDAVDIFCALCAREWGEELPERLTGWAGLTAMVPLLLRLGGRAAVVEAARQITEVGNWLP